MQLQGVESTNQPGMEQYINGIDQIALTLMNPACTKSRAIDALSICMLLVI